MVKVTITREGSTTPALLNKKNAEGARYGYPLHSECLTCSLGMLSPKEYDQLLSEGAVTIGVSGEKKVRLV